MSNQFSLNLFHFICPQFLSFRRVCGIEQAGSLFFPLLCRILLLKSAKLVYYLSICFRFQICIAVVSSLSPLFLRISVTLNPFTVVLVDRGAWRAMNHGVRDDWAHTGHALQEGAKLCVYIQTTTFNWKTLKHFILTHGCNSEGWNSVQFS